MAIVSAVTAFGTGSKSRRLVAVDADGRRLCAIQNRFFEKLPVAEGDVIDEDQYLDRLSALMFAPCYEDALTLLDRAAQASGELRAKLIRKGYLEAAADAAIARLTENRLVDDGDYARRTVERSEGKPVGVYALRRKLRAKGVDEDAVDEALALVDADAQIDAARALGEKLLHKYLGDPPRARRAKLSQALARRGFDWDTIGSALESIDLSEADVYDE